MRSWLKELINIVILVDGLTAVQSPRKTPVKNLARHSGTGNCLEQHVLDELAMRWYALVYFISVMERRM